MAHITTFRFKVKAGKLQDMRAAMDKWEKEQKPNAVGWQGSIIVQNNADPNEITNIVFWDNTENYNKNSDRPEQAAWYQEFRSYLTSDPVWFDGTVLLERRS